MTWPLVPLGHVAEIERNGIEASAIKTGTIYVGLENIRPGGEFEGVRAVEAGELASNKFAFDARHVLYGKLRPYLAKIARPSFDGICSTDIVPVLPGPRVDRDFLARFLLLPESVASANARSTGANLPRLSPTALAEIRVPLPPLAEQRRIAGILDRADALRAKRRAALALLDTLTQSIFLDMFGDPVSNPKQWENPTLGGLATSMHYGPRFFNEPYDPSGIRIVRITDLDESGALSFEGMPRLVVSDADRVNHALRSGDVIFARSGATVGKVALIRREDPPCIAGAYFIVMRFSARLDPTYVRGVLTALSTRSLVVARSRQAAQQNFSGPGLRALPMPVPPLRLQQDYAERVATIDKLKAAHRASLAQLDALFASLQHRAFRGEL